MTASNTSGAPAWIELFTRNADAAVDFYHQLFGWTAQPGDPAFGGYRIIERDGRPVAGLMPNDGSVEAPNAWTIYLETPDVQATAEKITKAGGHLLMEPMQVGDQCWSVFAADAAGAPVGGFQPLEHQGFADREGVHSPFWFENYSRDYPASVAFYRDAFDWDVHDVRGQIPYSTFGEGADALAGIMDGADFLPEGVGSHWTFYVRVEDATKTAELARSLGGEIVRSPEDSPFGRLAEIADPNGVTFKVVQPPEGETA